MSNDCCNDCCNEEPKKEPIRYASNTPYPPVCVQEENPAYARMMLDNIGGSNSEMSAISLYIYNNMITGNYDDISETFHKISIVEMHHLHIFGELALKLGENPRLWTHRGKHMSYWTPGYNQYPTVLGELLANAVSGEQDAIRKYERQADIIKDCHITDMLHRIIEDEELHIQIYKKLIKSLQNR